TVLTGTEEAITQHWADLVIGTSVPKGYLGEPLAEMHFVAVCHPQHPLAFLSSPIDPNELAQHLQLVIKDTSRSPDEKNGWLKSEQRWTVSEFDTAIDLLLNSVGFCWLPEHKVSTKLASGSLKKLSIEGSSFRIISAFLVKPKPDNIGPGTDMLYQQLIAHRQLTEYP
ncbi:MAG: DNA-binding transcriptional LysR family regulator, partial [Paraglaciecola sp.]